MQYSSVDTLRPETSHPNPTESDAQLRAELVRLQRENRMLTIALAEMERVAERDMLTPLYNRRYFLSALHRRIAAAAEKGERSALIYVDINGLKQLNDNFGHAAGDLALIEIARRLSEPMRGGDVLARIGGDEFGILLDNVSSAEARSWARRLKASVEDRVLDYGDHAIELSAAFGVAMVDRDRSAEDIIGSADNAMYMAKRRG